MAEDTVVVLAVLSMEVSIRIGIVVILFFCLPC